ncbi:glycosyltransferase family 4 protein [Ichthyenterobacterium sp. W332]|uniref:Glycosyltransferase family 4 protein n=1 Tax=Microcosmobacter mediterraneus TaxID=3075607 RepID=A0ABU2YKN6_9FLAO|nr:glycosyltransferase family 4 protein [Ichthyenterobacterium sp. W332]MDT0558728.1 glycosyltransferase family 4 protein [Ichthyenterobacterium sp. W332]
MNKILRITTVAGSLNRLLRGQLRFMNQYYEVVGVTSKGISFDRVIENEGIRVEPVEMTRTIAPIKDLVATYKLYKLIKKENPLIVHTHTPKAGILGMLAAKLAGVKHRYHTVAGMPLLEATGFKLKLLVAVEKLTYKFATKVFPNSYGLKTIIIDQGFCNKDKVKVIGNGSSNGIDIEHFNRKQVSNEQLDALKSELNISDNDFVYVYVGRLVKDKGINELITVFDDISKQLPNCKLVLVGFRERKLDPLKPETEKTIKDNPSIIEAGFQKDVRPYFALGKVLVFPSYREGFPNVVLQAGAMGIPSIVSDINGCNEIIIDGENGFIIPAKDTQELKKKMLHVLEDENHLKQLTLNSRENIVNRFQHKYIWEELLKIYTNAENKEHV